MAVMSAMGVQNRVIATYAPQHIKEQILPGVCTGKVVLAICMTEPHAGTDVANYRTNTQVHSDRIVLNGTKTLISRADEAQWFVVFTRIDSRSEEHTSELQSLMRISYAVFCLKNKKKNRDTTHNNMKITTTP